MTLAATVALWLVAVSGFNGVFETKGWVAPVVAAALLPLFVERGLAELRRRRPRWSPRLLRLGSLAVHLFLFFVVVGWALYPDTMVVALPTPGTLSALWNGFGSGMRLARESVPPIDVAPPFVAIATASVWWCAAASGAGQWSSASPALSTAPPITIYVATGILSQGNSGALPLWLLVACAGLAVVASDFTRRGVRWYRVVPAATACCAVLVAGAVAAPLLPRYGEPAALDFRNQIGTEISDNPLVDIKPRLVDLSPRVLFTVESPQQEYWRLTSLDAYADGVWRSSGQAPTMPPATTNRTRPATQEVQIVDLHSRWLPVASYPSTPPDTTVIDPATQAVVVPDKTRDNVTYEVISSVPRIDAIGIDSVSAPSRSRPEVAHYLERPDLSEPVRAWLAEATAGADTPYTRLSAVQQRMRSFRYDLNVAPGHGPDGLEEFLLETRAGYCEQFAAAVALLARELGIPSRVAVGYLPGEAVRLGSQGRTVYQVRSRDSHAWAEAWFQGWGWVRFDATPRGDNAVDPPPLGPQQAQVPETTPPEQAPETTQAPEPAPASTAVPGGGGTAEGWGGLVLVAAVVGVAACLVGSVLGAKALRRRRRHRSGVTGAWDEGRDLALDLGVRIRPGDTPTELADRAAEAGLDLRPLADMYLPAAFGPATGDDASTARAWAALDAARSELSRAGRSRFVRAVLSPRSLVRSSRLGAPRLAARRPGAPRPVSEAGSAEAGEPRPERAEIPAGVTRD